jgi:hypothetical protein
MALQRRAAFALGTILLSLSLAPQLKADAFSFQGTFQQDDDVQLYNFFVSTNSTPVTLQTWSFGGGNDAIGQAIPSGGFDTVLSLYDGSGALINYTTSWSCPPSNVDASSAQGCGDAVMMQPLDSGAYTVAVTEYYNLPNGFNLSDGFSQSGQGNFTGPNLCGTTGSFFDVKCDHRNGAFEVDIDGATTASAVPEPASIWITAFALLGVFAWMGISRVQYNRALSNGN